MAVDVNVSPSLSVANRTISDGFWVTGTNMFNVYDDMHYDLSPDGRTFVVVTPVNATTKVFVAVNWAEELRKEFNAGARK